MKKQGIILFAIVLASLSTAAHPMRAKFTIGNTGTEISDNLNAFTFGGAEFHVNPDSTDHTGFYAVFRYDGKETHKGFEDLQGIELVTADYRPNGPAVPVKPHGKVLSRRPLTMTKVSINGDHISFETVAAGGVSYSFEGDFLHPDDPQQPVLSGRMIKHAGATNSEAELQFVMEDRD